MSITSNKINKKLLVNSEKKNANNIANIIINIDKLKIGKIKHYNIHYLNDIEILCKYLQKKNILHRIYIKHYNHYISHKYSYEEFINDDNDCHVYFSKKNKQKIILPYELYIIVYKGFVELNDNNKNELKNRQFGTYLRPYQYHNF